MNKRRLLTRIIKDESARFTIELLLVKDFSYPHRFDRSTSCVAEEKVHAGFLKVWNHQFVRDIRSRRGKSQLRHEPQDGKRDPERSEVIVQSFDIVPICKALGSHKERYDRSGGLTT